MVTAETNVLETTERLGHVDDESGMRAAIDAAAAARRRAHPNPWVGAVILPGGYVGSTAAPGGPHAEQEALNRAKAANADLSGATVYVTLEPCCEFAGKRTPSCAEALIDAGVRRVVVGIPDPDPRVAGQGIIRLRKAGVEVVVGVLSDDIGDQLAPYIKHRTTGRPFVVLKLASSLDGRTAAPDGTSRWITGPEARVDVHRLRAESDAILVGAGTVRLDDPSLTVRHVEGRDPRRVVLGRAPAEAKVHPCDEMTGDLDEVLDALGADGVVQLLVEGVPEWRVRSIGGVSSTATSSTSHQSSSGVTTLPAGSGEPE